MPTPPVSIARSYVMSGSARAPFSATRPPSPLKRVITCATRSFLPELTDHLTGGEGTPGGAVLRQEAAQQQPHLGRVARRGRRGERVQPPRQPRGRRRRPGPPDLRVGGADAPLGVGERLLGELLAGTEPDEPHRHAGRAALRGVPLAEGEHRARTAGGERGPRGPPRPPGR